MRAFPSLLSVATALCLSALCLSALPAARAGDLKYPRTLPVMTLRVPDNWKVADVPGPGRLIVCTTPQDANYVVSLMTLPLATTALDRDAVLVQAARGAAESAGLTDITVSAVTEEKIKQGLRSFAMVHANGKLKGSPATVVYASFTLSEGGQFYLLGEAGPDASLLAHKEDFQKIANSIQSTNPTP